jgi:NaMN:DMB phosphoribosyltransferase
VRPAWRRARATDAASRRALDPVRAVDEVGEPEGVPVLDADLDALARRHDVGVDGRTVLEWEYLLLTARRR